MEYELRCEKFTDIRQNAGYRGIGHISVQLPRTITFKPVSRPPDPIELVGEFLGTRGSIRFKTITQAKKEARKMNNDGKQVSGIYRNIPLYNIEQKPKVKKVNGVQVKFFGSAPT